MINMFIINFKKMERKKINIFVNEDFERKMKSLPKEIQNVVNKTLLSIHNGNLSSVTKIPSSDLYTKNVGEYVLIFSKKEESIFIMNLMSKKEFSGEYKKSLFLF